VFTARYTPSPCLRQTPFVCKELNRPKRTLEVYENNYFEPVSIIYSNFCVNTCHMSFRTVSLELNKKHSTPYSLGN